MAIPGIDYLLGKKYIRTAAAVHPDGWAAGFLLDVSGIGNAFAQIEWFCRNAKPSSVRIHGMWSDSHQFPKAVWPEMVKRAQQVAILAAKFPSIQFFYSPALEHRLNQADATALLLQCSQVLPAAVKLVNSYISPGSSVPSVINEVHNVSPSKPKNSPFGYFTSFDDESMVNADCEKHKRTYSDAHINFAWEFRNNLRAGEKDKTPRPARKAVPSKEYLQSEIRLMQPIGKAPKFTVRPNKRYGSKALLKSHSEDGLNMGTRANKLMFVIPEKASEAILIDCKGRVVAKAKYYGSYEGGRHRYYFSEYGYQIGLKALKQSGSEWVMLKVGNAIYEPANPAFRKGSFQ